MDLAFAYLRERDIDILLVEELTVNSDFVAWFCTQVNPELKNATVVGVAQSLNTKYDGETDIQLIVDSKIGRVGILIEDKIDALPQPNQAIRYKARGEAGLAAGRWSRFHTCLAATRKYIDGPYEAAQYDARVSYEMMVTFFDAMEGSRAAFKAAMLREAIEQNRRGPTTEPHDEATEFFRRYYDLVQEEAPPLNPDLPRPRSAGSRWMVFRPGSFPRGVVLRHKLPQGEVRLYVRARGDAVLDLASRFRPHMDQDMRLEWTEASVTIHIQTPQVLPRDESVAFDEVVDDLRFAVRQAERLAGLYGRVDL